MLYSFNIEEVEMKKRMIQAYEYLTQLVARNDKYFERHEKEFVMNFKRNLAYAVPDNKRGRKIGYRDIAARCPYKIHERKKVGRASTRGLADIQSGRIYLKKDLPEYDKIETLLHEWSHVVHAEYCDSFHSMTGFQREVIAGAVAFVVGKCLNLSFRFAPFYVWLYIPPQYKKEYLNFDYIKQDVFKVADIILRQLEGREV